MSREEELKALFLAEALEQHESLNRLFTQLEKDHADISSVNAVFRITHTMKANAAALGLEGIAELAHLLEDIFSLFKKGKARIDAETFNSLFRAIDKLGELIASVKTEARVPYKGMAAKLKALLRNLKGEEFGEETPPAPRQGETAQPADPQPETESPGQEDSAKDAPEDPAKPAAISFSDYVQVPIKKLDQLLNLVGELVIERDRLMTESLQRQQSKASNFAPLYRISADLQYAVMSVRLVKVDVLFNKFHRIVRDVAAKEEKQVDLLLEGTDIEIDRNVLQTISESLIHLVRNAISHGIESPGERKAAGKPERGTVRLSARNDKDAVSIDIIDDGKGIDPAVIRRKAVEKGLLPADVAAQLSDREAINIIFESGFSSKDEVTDVSGRGVGMDAVKKAVETIGGEVRIQTELGKGSVFTLVLPASMAVKKALLFDVGGRTYAIALSFIDSVIQLRTSDLHRVGKGLMATHAERTMNVLFLQDVFAGGQVANLQDALERLPEKGNFYVILLHIDGKWVGIGVDRLIQQKEIIEKPIAGPVGQARFISGATILGDGQVCLVVDVPAVVRNFVSHAVQAHTQS
jgi:two-component system chemotaxis sensor kinase CheA